MTASADSGRGGTGGAGGAATADIADALERLSAIQHWYCVSTGNGACTCIENTKAYDENYCTLAPTACCYALLDEMDAGCECYREGSQGCSDVSTVADAVARIEKCPP